MGVVSVEEIHELPTRGGGGPQSGDRPTEFSRAVESHFSNRPKTTPQDSAFDNRGEGSSKANTTKQVSREEAREIYNEHRYYHGTTSEAKVSIQRHGFSFERKEVLGDSELLKTSHYLTEDKDIAKTFANQKVETKDGDARHAAYQRLTPEAYEKLQRQGGDVTWETYQPAVVRVLLDKDRKNRLKRTIVPGISKTFRSEENIPSNHVLGKKGTGVGHDVFGKILNERGYGVTPQDAKRILDDVQSSDEGDFL